MITKKQQELREIHQTIIKDLYEFISAQNLKLNLKYNVIDYTGDQFITLTGGGEIKYYIWQLIIKDNDILAYYPPYNLNCKMIASLSDPDYKTKVLDYLIKHHGTENHKT